MIPRLPSRAAPRSAPSRRCSPAAPAPSAPHRCCAGRGPNRADLADDLRGATCRCRSTAAVGGRAPARGARRRDGDVAAVDRRRGIDELRDIGRTRALMLRPTSSTYGLRYRVTNRRPGRSAARSGCRRRRPTAGRGRCASSATLPSGAAPSGTMPSFAWSGARRHRRRSATCRRSSDCPTPPTDAGRAVEPRPADGRRLDRRARAGVAAVAAAQQGAGQ